MKRKDFIKRSAIAGFLITTLGDSRIVRDACTPTPVETEGPFPTHNPNTLVAQNIISDRKGTSLKINIKVYNINDNCTGLKDAIVDIWHCDSKGEYSEYGGKQENGHPRGPEGMKMPAPDDANRSHMPPPPPGAGGMQSADHIKEHYLRGRQRTNPQGEVSFISIYPGWYISRAPHIHLHIYNSVGGSLLITQIALPEDVSKDVYSQGVYSARGLPQTTNATDNVFFDSVANELATIKGNSKDGFVLTHSIYVKA